MPLDIFNLKKLGFNENTKFSRGLVVSGKKFQLGQPCIVQCDNDEKYHFKDVNIMILNGQNLNSPQVKLVPMSTLKLIGSYDINKHEIIDVDNKDINFKKDILIEATSNGNIGKSFVFRESIFNTYLEDIIHNAFPIRSWFRYNSLIRYDFFDFPRLEKARGLDMAVIVSFFPLADSVPVFNSKEVDGFSMSISLSLLVDNSHYLNRINLFSIGFTLNNYKHAVHEIDGEELGLSRRFTNNEISHLISFTMSSIKTLDLYKNQFFKKVKETEKNDKEVVNKQYVRYNSDSTTSTATTTNYY